MTEKPKQEEVWEDIPGEDERSSQMNEESFTETEYLKNQAKLLQVNIEISDQNTRDDTGVGLSSTQQRARREHETDEGNGTMSTTISELPDGGSSLSEESEKLNRVEKLVKNIYAADSVESLELLETIENLRKGNPASQQENNRCSKEGSQSTSAATQTEVEMQISGNEDTDKNSGCSDLCSKPRGCVLQ